MSVQLSDAVGKLETPRQFNALLERDIEHTVSWNGKRMVSVERYEGSVEIHTLIRQFLHIAPMASIPGTLSGRLQWYDLYDRMQEVCRRSDEAWQKTLVKYILFEKPAQDSMDFFRQGESFKNQLLTFSRKTLICLWPEKAELVSGHPERATFTVERAQLAAVVYALEGKTGYSIT